MDSGGPADPDGPLALVVNPTAGRGRAGRAAAEVADRIRDRSVAVTVLAGRDAAEAGDLLAAAVADGTCGVLALGGDGMVNLALQAVAGTPVPLGILPAGTGNDFAASLELPGDLRAATDLALDALATGTRRTVDAVRSGDRWWGCVLGAGFDSAVTERANRMTWPRGPRRYDLAILAELRVFRPQPFRIVLDGEPWDTEAMLVAVGNGRSYGAGMRVTPAAQLDDGLLDVMVLHPVSKPRFARSFPSVYRGTHVDLPFVSTRRARVVELISDGMVAYADGERLGELPVRSEVVPGALHLLAPPLP